MKNSFYKNIFYFILLSFAISCAPKIKNLHLYQRHHLPSSSFLPTKDNLKGVAPKVLVFNFNENEIKTAKDAGLGSSLAVDIENILTNDRLVEILDRNIAKNLEKEIMLSQITNDQVSYDGPRVADFAISGAIKDASFTKKYISSKLLYDKERGLYKTPAKHSYSSTVAGNVKIYEIPSMQVVENIEFSGYASRSENVQKSGGVSIGGIIEVGVDQEKGRESDDSLTRSAGENGVNYISAALKTAFAKKGYILEKRVLKNKSIFKINLGSQDGIKHGDKFEIIGKFEVENPITGEVEIEKRILGTGRVSDQINPRFSFIVLDKKLYDQLVRLGDVIKFKYERTFSQKLSKYNKYIPN